jgi:hypothetical protein
MKNWAIRLASGSFAPAILRILGFLDRNRRSKSLRRVILAGLLTLVLSLAFASLARFQMSQVQEHAQRLIDNSLQGRPAASDFLVTIATSRACLGDLLDPDGDKPARDRIGQRLEGFEQDAQAKLDAYSRTIAVTPDRRNYDAVVERNSGYWKAIAKLRETLAESGLPAARQMLRNDVAPLYQSLVAATNELREFKRQRMLTMADAALRDSEFGRVANTASTVIVIPAGIALLVLLLALWLFALLRPSA